MSLNTSNASTDEIEVISIQICTSVFRDNAINSEFTKYVNEDTTSISVAISAFKKNNSGIF
jgi:hypothetical protein